MEAVLVDPAQPLDKQVQLHHHHHAGCVDTPRQGQFDVLLHKVTDSMAALATDAAAAATVHNLQVRSYH